MPEVLDERVVEMRFDNSQFETNVNQSIKTINKLKESLDFDNAEESFENISAAAAKCNVEPLEKSLESVTVKFDMLELVAANVLGRIVNQAIDAGTRLVKSLSIDQVTAGWNKYQQKTESVQTIMAATGVSIDYVNSRLEDLIWFADETSYSFTDMVNNIGKFTSAGVDLDTAVDSMMGISNWAALSGAGIQQASRAMYNLSQSIGMGYVAVQDWKSIELANMATMEFKETVIETALELGRIREVADGVYVAVGGKTEFTAESLRTTLKDKWFDNDVLTETLKKFSDFSIKVKEYQETYEEAHGVWLNASKAMQAMEEEGLVDVTSLGYRAFKKAQEAITLTQAIEATADAASSSWMTTFELIFGNYEKATKLWTELANDMWDIFAGPGEQRNTALSNILDSNYQKLLKTVYDGEQFADDLSVELYNMMSANYGVEYANEMFSRYDSLEEMLQNESFYNSTLRGIFKKIADDSAAMAEQTNIGISALESGKLALRQIVLRLSSGQYGSSEEQQRQILENMGIYNYDYILELAERWRAGEEIAWEEENAQLLKDLKDRKSYIDNYVDSIRKLDPTESFYSGLSKLGGRQELIGGLQNIFKSIKNIYLLIVELGNNISDLTGSETGLGKILDFFYKFTSVIAFTDKKFEILKESMYSLFHGGFQQMWHDFWYGTDELQSSGKYFDALTGEYERVSEVSKHIPGALEKIRGAYDEYIGRLPERVANTINSIRQKISEYVGQLPQQIKDLKETIFGHFEEQEFLTKNGSIVTKIVHVGGLLNNFKDDIKKLAGDLGGKAFSGLISIFGKIGDFLFGYEKDGEKINGILVPIYDKISAFWKMLKDIGKTIKEFFLGKDITGGKYFDALTGNYERVLIHIPGLFEKIKNTITSITDSEAYKSVHKFIFGDEESKTPNIFGKIKGKIDEIGKSATYQAIHKFIFGDEESKTPNIFGKIKEKIDEIGKSATYQAIHKFIFGDEESKTPNIFGKIKGIIDEIGKSATYQAIHKFIFGDEESKTPNIFGKIKGMINEIGKSATYQAIHKFIFGDEESKTPNIFGKIKGIIDEIGKSATYQAIHKFIFGDEESKTPNIFGKIKGIIDEIGKSATYQAIHKFIFGDEKTEAPSIFERIKSLIQSIADSAAFKAIKGFLFGEPDENGGHPDNVLARIKSDLQSIWDSKAFRGIRKFFFGDEDENPGLTEAAATIYEASNNGQAVIRQASYNPQSNKYEIKDDSGRIISFTPEEKKSLTGFQSLILGIKEKFEAVRNSKAFNDVKEFFFGKKNPVYNEKFEIVGYIQDTPDLVTRLREQFKSLPETIKNAKNAIVDFLLGPVNEEGKRTENFFKRIPGYFKQAKESVTVFFKGNPDEGKKGILAVVREKIEQLKQEQPWFATFCGFIETQITNIKGVIDDANGSVTTAISNLTSYLFGGKIKKNVTNELGEVVTELTPVNGVVTEIRENVEKLLHGGKEDKKGNFLSGIAEKLGFVKPSLITTIGRIVLSLIGLNFLFTKVDLGKLGEWGFKSVFEVMIEEFDDFADGLLKLVISFALIAVLTKILQNDYKTTAIALGVIIIIAHALSSAYEGIRDEMGKDMKSNFAAVMAIKFISDAIMQLTLIAAALMIFIKVFKISTTDILKAVGIIGALFLFIGISARMMTTVAKQGEQIKTASSSFWGIAAMLFGMSQLLSTLAIVFVGLHLFTKGKDLSEFKNAIELIKMALIAIAGMVVVMAVSMAIMGTTAKNINISTVLLLVSLIGGLYTIILSLTMLYAITKNADWRLLTVIFAGISAILLAISGSIAIILSIKKINKSNIGVIAMLPFLIAALGAVAYALSILSKNAPINNVQSLEKLLIFFGIMGAVLVMMLPLIGVFAIIGKLRKVISDDALYSFGELVIAFMEVGILVSAICIAISSIPIPDISSLAKFFAAILAVMVLLVGMTAVLKLIQKINSIQIKNVNKNNPGIIFSDVFLGLLAVTFLAAGIVAISSRIPAGTWNQVGKFLATLVVSVGCLALLTEVFNRIRAYKLYDISKKQYTAIWKTVFPNLLFALIELTGAIVLISYLSHLINFGSIFSLAGYLVSLIVAIEVISRIADVFKKIESLESFKVDEYQKLAKSFGACVLAMLAVAGAAALIIAAVEILEAIRGGTSIISLAGFLGALYAITFIMGELVEIIAHINDYEKDLDQDNSKKLYSAAFKIIGLLSLLSIITGLIILTASKLPLQNNENGAYTAVLVFLGSLFLLTVIMDVLVRIIERMINYEKTLFKTDRDRLYKGILNIVVTLIALGAVTALFILAASQLPLNGDENDAFLNVLKFYTAMALLPAILLGMQKIMEKVVESGRNLAKITGKQILGIFIRVFAFTSVMLIITTGLILVANELNNRLSNLGSLLSFAAAVGIVGVLVLFLFGLMALMSRIGQWGRVFQKGRAGQLLKLFGVVSVVILGLAGIVGILSWFSKIIGDIASFDNLLVNIVKVAAVILVLSAIVTAIGFFAQFGKSMAGNAAVFMAEIVVIMAVIGLLVAAIGWIFEKIESIDGIGQGGIVDGINKFGDMLEALANSLGRAFGGLLGGIGEGLTNSLETIGDNLAKFIEAVWPFLDSLQTLNERHAQGIAIFTAVMGGILEATFYEKITEVISKIGGNGDLSTILDSLSTMIKDHLIEFLNEIAKIPEGSADNMVIFNNVMVKILEASFYASIANILQHLGNIETIPSVIKNLKEMVTGHLVPLLNEIANIKPEDSENFDRFNGLMVKILEASFYGGIAGVLQYLGGEGALPTIIKNLKEMVIGNLRPFLDEIANISDTDSDNLGRFNTLMLGIVTATFLGKIADIISHLGPNGDLITVVTNLKNAYETAIRPFIDNLKQTLTDDDTKILGDFDLLMLALVGAAFLDKVTNVISQLGPDNQTKQIIDSLNDIYTNGLRPFITEVSKITDDDKNAVSNFNSIMARIVGATFYGKVADVIAKLGDDGDLTQVISRLKEMVGDLEPFLKEVRKIEENDVTYAGYFTSIMQSIMESTFYGKVADVVKDLGTDGDLSTVITTLKDSVSNLEDFLGSIRTIKPEDPGYAENFTKIMGFILGSTFFGKLAGIISELGKPTNLGSLFVNLTTMTAGMMGFLAATTELKDTHVEGAKKFSAIMGSILGATVEVGAIGALDTIIGYFTGDAKYDTYMANMKILAEGAKDISDKVQGVNTTQVNAAMESVKTILGIATDNRFKSGGWGERISNFINGTTDFKGLFALLTGNEGQHDGVIDYLKDFCDKVGTQDFSNAKNASNAINALFSIISFDPKNLKKFKDMKGGYGTDQVDDILKSIEYITNNIIPELQDIQSKASGKDISELSKVFSVIKNLFNLIYKDSYDYSYTYLDDGALQTGVLSSITFIKDQLLSELIKLNNEIGSNDFSSVKNISDVIKSVFELFTFNKNIDDFANNKLSKERIDTAFGKIRDWVIADMQSLQDSISEAGIDSNLISDVIGSYAELINAAINLQTSAGDGEGVDMSNIGQFVVQGLVLALTSEESTSSVKEAAYNLGLKLLEGLKEGTAVASPSKEAMAIGQFVADGLMIGLASGESMTYQMARMFGEGTIKALEDGVVTYAKRGTTQHAINMVVEDLLDKNRFDMPDFSTKNRFGQDIYDFDAIEKWMNENFNEIYDPSYIHGFVGAWRTEMEKVPKVIEDADYAELMHNIAVGDYGFGEDNIIAALEAEGKSAAEATLAMQDYNDILAGNLKISKDLAKERKQNPPMTEEQWEAMWQHEIEGKEKFNNNEFRKLAEQNGTTWQEEAIKQGHDPEHIQAMWNKEWREYGMDQESYFRHLAERELEAMYEAENGAQRSAISVVGAVNSETEAVEENTEVLNDQKDAIDAVADANENKTESITEQDNATKAATESTENLTAALNEQNDAASGKQTEADRLAEIDAAAKTATLDYHLLNKEIERARENPDYEFSDDFMKQAAIASAATQKYGKFGTGIDHRQAQFQTKSNGAMSVKNAAWLAKYVSQTGQTIEEFNKAQYELNKAADVSDTATKVEESTKLVSHAYDNASKDVKSFVDRYVEKAINALEKGKTEIELTTTEFQEMVGDSIDISSLLQGMDLGENGKITIDLLDGKHIDEINKKELLKQVKDINYKNVLTAGLFGDAAGGTAQASMDNLLPTLYKFVKNPKGAVISGLGNAALNASRQLLSLSEDTKDNYEEIANTEIDPKIDYSGAATFDAYLDEIYKKYELLNEGRIATQGFNNLQNGKNLSKEQAEELQKVIDLMNMGRWSAEELEEQFGISWDALRQIIGEGGKVDWSQYSSSSLNHAKMIKEEFIDAGKEYTIKQLMEESNAGLWGADAAERKKAYKEAGMDAEEAEKKFQEYLKFGEKALEGVTTDQIALTDEEQKAIEQAEKMEEALNSTPQGAFRAIADFLDGVTSVLKDKGTADDFNKFITSVTDSLDSIELKNASQFEKIYNFLNVIRMTANGYSGIADNFAQFVTNIKGSIEQLDDISIDNPEAMDKVVEFLNGIEIKNEDTLSKVSSFIDVILKFADGPDESGYANSLVKAIDDMMNSINSLKFDNEANTTPLVQFLKDLTDAAGILSNTGPGTVSAFVSNLYTALQNSKSQAGAAASTIAKEVIRVFEAYSLEFKSIGYTYMLNLVAGMEKGRFDVLAQAQSIAGTITSGIKEQLNTNAGEVQQAIKDLFNPSDLAGEESPINPQDVLNKNPDEIEDAVAALESSTEEKEPKSFGTQFGEQFVQDMIGSIQNGAGDVSGMLESMASSISTALEDESEGGLKHTIENLNGALSGIVPDGLSLANGMIQGIITGIVNGAEDVKDAINWLASGVQGEYKEADKTNSPSKVYQEFAGYEIAGLVLGIKNGIHDVTNAMAGLAEAGQDAFNEENDAHSPSKAYQRYAGWILQGILLGVNNGEDEVVKEIAGVATTSTDAFMNAIEAAGMAGEMDDALLEVFKDQTALTKMQAEAIQEIWTDCMNGVYGVLDGTDLDRNKQLQKLFGLTWEQLYSLSDGMGHLDLTKLTTGLTEYGEAASELSSNSGLFDVIHGIYEGKLGRDQASLDALNKDAGFVQYLLQEWWKTGDNGIDWEFIDENYDALLQAYYDAMTAGKNLFEDPSLVPVIRPVIDDSSLAASRLNIEAETNRKQANDISTRKNPTVVVRDDEDLNDLSKSAGVTQVIQNNYSPRALSRLEIYRQTKNLFATMTMKQGRAVQYDTLS